jgi:hypothetical protein
MMFLGLSAAHPLCITATNNNAVRNLILSPLMIQ